jgi:hypothetical protein
MHQKTREAPGLQLRCIILIAWNLKTIHMRITAKRYHVVENLFEKYYSSNVPKRPGSTAITCS